MADDTSPTGDELIAKSEQATLDADRARRAANLFDLRKIIAGLFLVYGVILTIAGITDSDAEVHKAADIRINLWVGLAMLVVSALFIAWALWRPLGEQIVDDDEPAAGA
jgi:xanthine/uracil/vitamin C permease (AzgA family)